MSLFIIGIGLLIAVVAGINFITPLAKGMVPSTVHDLLNPHAHFATWFVAIFHHLFRLLPAIAFFW